MMSWAEKERIVYGIMAMLRTGGLNKEDQILLMRLVREELEKEDEDGNE